MNNNYIGWFVNILIFRILQEKAIWVSTIQHLSMAPSDQQSRDTWAYAPHYCNCSSGCWLGMGYSPLSFLWFWNDRLDNQEKNKDSVKFWILQFKRNRGEGNKRHFGHYEGNLKSYLPGKVVHLEYKSSNLPGKVCLIWNTKVQFPR